MNTYDNGHIEAIIFDFGGVLLDWNPRYLFGKYFKNDPDGMETFLIEIGFTEWNRELDRGRPYPDAVAELCARFPHRADLIRAFDNHWEESISGPIQATVDILRALKKAGYPLYGLSNWSADTFRRVRPTYEFFNWLDVILISGEVGLIKPDPRIYHLMLERIDRSAEECLFIDDSLPNIEEANRLGFTTIHFESPEQLAADIQSLHLLP